MSNETVADLGAIAMTEGTAPNVDVPVNLPPSADPDSGMVCQVCGKDISHLYGGRGRKPTRCEEHKRGGASSLNPKGVSGSGDVKAAVASLEQAYGLLQMGLLLAGLTESATALGASIPGLSEKNAQYLATDKELVKRINKVGKTGGRAGFVISQATVLAPVAIIATKELQARAAERKPKANEDDVPFAQYAGDSGE